MPPVNDEVSNATVISANGSISGTTVGSTVDTGPGSEDAFGYVNTVWYRIEVPTTGILKMTLTAWSFEAYSEAYLIAPGDDPPADSADAFNGTYLNQLWFDSDSSFPHLVGSTAVTAGAVIYLLVTSNSFIEGDTGTFSFTITMPLNYVCLNASGYIGSSAGASIVSGNVRETQLWDNDTVSPFEGWFGDLEPTLTFPGADIAVDGPGLYAAKLTFVNANHGFSQAAWAGLKRNGQTLYPGTQFLHTESAAQREEWLTIPADNSVTFIPGPDEVDDNEMLWYVPVKPGDTIDVMVCSLNPGEHLDIVKICWAKVITATDGPAYDTVTWPDYPLGMSSGDLSSQPNAQGPLFEALAAYNGYSATRFSMEGLDLVVTNDGTIWVAWHNQAQFGPPWNGPILAKWSGSSWTIVNDDIAGLGANRANRGSSGVSFGPSGVCLATDGTDIWIAYGMDQGPGPRGGFRNMAIEVRKYNVGGNSWSTIGGPVAYNTTTVGNHSQAGEVGTTPFLAFSPGGDLWLAFYDSQDVEDPLQHNALAAYPLPACAAKWNGSSWDVYRLERPTMMPEEFPTGLSVMTHFAPQTYRNAGSGTTSAVTEDGEASVKESQTALTNKTLQGMIPPAGRWSIAVRVKKKHTGGAGNSTISTRFYKNGVGMNGPSVDPQLFSSGTVAFTWLPATPYDGTFNGTTDTLEIALATPSSPAGVETYVSDVVLIPAWVNNTLGGNWYIPFVDDGQWHHMLAWKDGDDNPYSLHQFLQFDPDSTPTNSYNQDTMQGWHLWSFQKFDGSAFNRIWERIPEDDLPDQVVIKTRPLAHPNNYYGHWQEGMSFGSDGTDVFMAANLGVNSNGIDTFIFAKCGTAGFEPFGEIGHLGGSGLTAHASSFGGTWTWSMHAHAMLLDDRGNHWFVNGINAAMEAEGIAVMNYVPNTGIGDWFVASDDQVLFGFDQFDIAGALAISPDGTKLYFMQGIGIASGPLVPQPNVLGVWELTINQDAKIPLILAFGGVVSMNWRSSDRRGSANRVLVGRG